MFTFRVVDQYNVPFLPFGGGEVSATLNLFDFSVGVGREEFFAFLLFCFSVMNSGLVMGVPAEQREDFLKTKSYLLSNLKYMIPNVFFTYRFPCEDTFA